MQMCGKMTHLSIPSSFLCRTVLKYGRKQIQVDNKMIPSLATSSYLILCLRNMSPKVKVLQVCILEFIKLDIDVTTKLVNGISWLPLDRINLKLELKQILYIHLYHLQIILFAYP